MTRLESIQKKTWDFFRASRFGKESALDEHDVKQIVHHAYVLFDLGIDAELLMTLKETREQLEAARILLEKKMET